MTPSTRISRVSSALVLLTLSAGVMQAQPKGTIVASNMDAHTVTIVDVASARTLATIPVGQGPHEVAISPDGKQAVVAIYGNRNAIGNSLAVFDLTKPEATPRSVELGAGNQRPHGLAYLPDGKHLLVTGERAQRVLVVNLETQAIDSSMSTGQATTHMVSLTADGSHAYTTNIAAMSVSALDVKSRKVSAPYTIGVRVEGIAVMPNGKEVWVGGNESHLVYALDANTGAITHRIEGFGMPYRIGMTPNGRTAVISDPGSEKIHIADVATHAVRITIDVPPQSPADGSAARPASPQGVTISRDGAYAFVTLKAVAKVAVVDIARGEIVKTLTVGAGSDGVGYSPLVSGR
ncbi:MAG: beta-propeller fold lactonase family protein [Gemmatimonadaceae bacterium]|nr:beta-propeller fold lactonase family protein [Gemmatimonadaceae bacterium]